MALNAKVYKLARKIGKELNVFSYDHYEKECDKNPELFIVEILIALRDDLQGRGRHSRLALEYVGGDEIRREAQALLESKRGAQTRVAKSRR
jgi:hypothetical protein